MTKSNRIIVALDYDDSHRAWALVEQLGDSADF